MARGLDFVLARNSFYVKTYRRMLVVSIILTILMALLIFLNVYISKTHPRSKYFPSTPDGKLIKDPPLDVNHLHMDRLTIFPDGSVEDAPKWLNLLGEPDRENAVVRIWTERALEQIFTYDFINYRISITHLRELFTESAYKKFKIGLYESRNIETVKAENSIVFLEFLEEPRLLRQGIVNGAVMAWQYVVPTQITFESVTKPHVIKMLIKVVVVRDSILNVDFFGLKIAQLNTKIIED